MSSNRYNTNQDAMNAEPHTEQEFNEQDYPSVEPVPVSRQSARDAERIGDILRRVREHRGEDLVSISEYLCIRPNYLYALERSRYEELPADAYVIGFLRSYATYLGLDGRGAIDQYRREMSGRRRKPQLSMPQPMAEGRAPTVAVIIGGAFAALLLYGVWYGLSSPDHDSSKEAGTEQEVSTTLSPSEKQGEATASPPNMTLQGQTATADGIALTVPASAIKDSTLPASTHEDKNQTPIPNQQTPAVSGTTALTPQTQSPAPTVEDATKTKTDKDAAATKEQKDKTASKQEAQTQPKPAEPAQATTPAATTPATTPAATPPAKTEKPTAFGEKGRVTIKAEKESWILVTDSKGNTVFDKTLKPGETYSVPSGKGLKLTTGNASGVSFALDGQTLPKMNATDKVVRAISLEPEKIKGRLTGGNAETTETEEPSGD